jgi:hypothetical protein
MLGVNSVDCLSLDTGVVVFRCFVSKALGIGISFGGSDLVFEKGLKFESFIIITDDGRSGLLGPGVVLVVLGSSNELLKPLALVCRGLLVNGGVISAL